MRYQCSMCVKSYVWPFDLKRHMKNVHSSQQQQQQPPPPQQQPPSQQQPPPMQQQPPPQQQQQPPPQQQQPPPPQHQQQQQRFTFLHPYTAICSGPTSCGKTYLIMTLLQKNQEKIYPPPQRIVWLYRRWQTLYEEIQKSVRPAVEFIQGIPLDLDKDSFLDPNVRNLIVLDDLMSVKDARINDLFTEGSHHRNLSVIAINQNLYFNKDPTQRRNCHYLILFNNPIDKQQIMTLARQMYPRKSYVFMDKFEEATSKQYGYMMVDLKPTTPDSHRLQSNVLDRQISSNDKAEKSDDKVESIKGTVGVDVSHSSEDYQSEQTCDMASCDDCGTMFADHHDLQRHVKRWCPEKSDAEKGYAELRTLNPPDYYQSRKYAELKTLQPPDYYQQEQYADLKTLSPPNNTKRKADNLPERSSKKMRWGETRENEAFEDLVDVSKKQTKTLWDEKMKKYTENGISEKEAKEKAERKLKSEDLKALIDNYIVIIKYIVRLKNGMLHRKVMEKVQQYAEEGYDWLKAIRMAVGKYKHQLETFLEKDEESESETETEGEEEETGDDEDEEVE